MSNKKKLIRQKFRKAVFTRDGYRCRNCGKEGTEDTLDAHHITDRTLMPSGGYVAQNGISLCEPCHEQAEIFHSTGEALPGFSVEDLYKLIGSSYEKALRASQGIK
jgi:predicted restriction endonuclease